MRNFGEVVDRIKAEIPPDHPASSAIDDFMRHTYPYRAPERMHDNWYSLCLILADNLPSALADDSPDWVKKVGRIARAEE